MNGLGERILQARKDAGLTQEQLGERVGVSKVSISKWEKGQELSLNNGAALARALGIPLEQLLYGLTESSSVTVRKIPIIGTTQAGPSKEWFDLGFPVGWSDEYVDFPSQSPNVYALKVSGNSMSHRILAGEAVLVDPNAEPATGEEVVVKCTTGEVMVKVLAAIRQGQALLDSYNNGYDRIVKPLNEIKFMHAVIGVARSSRIMHSIKRNK